MGSEGIRENKLVRGACGSDWGQVSRHLGGEWMQLPRFYCKDGWPQNSFPEAMGLKLSCRYPSEENSTGLEDFGPRLFLFRTNSYFQVWDIVKGLVCRVSPWCHVGWRGKMASPATSGCPEFTVGRLSTCAWTVEARVVGKAWTSTVISIWSLAFLPPLPVTGVDRSTYLLCLIRTFPFVFPSFATQATTRVERHMFNTKYFQNLLFIYMCFNYMHVLFLNEWLAKKCIKILK